MVFNLFQIAPQDQSIYYLGQIFGYVGTLLPALNPNLLIGILFKGLNTIALTIGAFMVVYVTVVGLLKTAQEGEFLGRQWNALWVPLRTVGGIAALFPTATGYSAIQVIIMWIILQGVGAADVMWNRVIDFVTINGGGPYAGVDSGTLNTFGTQPQIKQLFQGLMCQASAKATFSDVDTSSTGGSQPIQYYCAHANSNDAFCALNDSDMLNPLAGGQVVQATSPQSNPYYQMGPGGRCGSLTYCNVDTACKVASDTTGPSTQACYSCKAQQAALQAIVPALGAVAKKLVTVDNQYVQFYETPGGGSAAQWIKDYCGIKGVNPAQCCRVPPKQMQSSILKFISTANICSMNLFPNDKAVDSKGVIVSYADATSSSSQQLNPANAATDLYLQYPLSDYLNGSDPVNAAVGEYAAALVGAASSWMQEQMTKVDISQGKWQNLAKVYGWIMAGGFYYEIAKVNQKNIDAAYPVLKYELNDNNKMNAQYRTNYSAVGALLTAMTTKTQGNSSSFTNTPGWSGDISGSIGEASATLLKSWQNSMRYNTTSASNPVISIATFGYQMMITAQLLFVVITTAAAAFAALTSINPIFMGFGVTESPFYAAFKVLVNLVGPFFFILIASLYSIGAMLGIYVPLIPYMIFTLGAIGWLIAAVEAMVAGPIIALGILSPGGQHDILGRAEPALMQLLNLFLRPSLMIIGLILSMFMSMVVVNLVNSGFLAATQQIIRNPGLFEQILFIAAYTSFIITVLNKAFSLIYVIPERITTWIGGHAVSYGEEQAMGETKSAVQGAASKSAKGMKETASHGAEKMGKAAGKGRTDHKKHKALGAPGLKEGDNKE